MWWMIADMTEEKTLGFRCGECANLVFADQQTYELHLIRHQLEDVTRWLEDIAEILAVIDFGRRKD